MRMLPEVAAESSEIVAVMRRVIAAWNSRDIATFNNLYVSDERFRGIGTDAEEFWVGSEFLAVRQAQFDEMPEFELRLDRIDAFEEGTVGWVASTGILATPTGDHPLRVTAVFVLEAGLWRIILWNTSIARSNLELFEIQLPTTLNDLLASVSGDSAVMAALTSTEEIVTLVFTDVIDSTAIASQIGDSAWAVMIERYEAVIDEITQRHGGRVVKTLGDGSMLAFNSAREAIRASVEIQRAFADEDFDLRIGVHSGHVVHSEDDLLGVTVNKAARVAAASDGGAVLVSATTKDLVGSLEGIRFGPPRSLSLKGLEGTHQVVSLEWET